MPKPKRSNLLALAILSLLNERPMHPYEIGSTMRHRGLSDSIRLNTGSLYAVMESLVKNGHIQPVGTEREGRHPERTVYEPTEAGRREFFDWLQSLLRTPIKEYPQFAAGLSFLAHLTPQQALELLEERMQSQQSQLEQVKASMKETRQLGIARLFLIEQEYVIAMMEAELDWLRRFVADLRDSSLNLHAGEDWTWAATPFYPEQE